MNGNPPMPGPQPGYQQQYQQQQQYQTTGGGGGVAGVTGQGEQKQQQQQQQIHQQQQQPQQIPQQQHQPPQAYPVQAPAMPTASPVSMDEPASKRKKRATRACDACRKAKVACDAGNPTLSTAAGPATAPSAAAAAAASSSTSSSAVPQNQPHPANPSSTSSNEGTTSSANPPSAAPPTLIATTDEPCTLCKLKKIPCTFIETSKRRAPPKGYIDQLENRIQALEALLNSVAPGLLEKYDTEEGRESSLLLSRDDSGSEDDYAPKEEDDDLQQAGGGGAGLSRRPSGKASKDRDRKSATRRSSTKRKDPPAARRYSRGSDAQQPARRFNGDDQNPSSNRDGKDGRSESGDLEALTDTISDMTLDGRYFGESSTYRIVQRLKETGRPASTGTPTRATSPVVTPPTSSERSYVERRMESDLASRTSKLFPLPPREVCLPLLELFFTHIHPHVPILHKPSFMHKFEEIIVNRTDEAFVSLLFVVMALGCRFSDDPIVYTDFGLLNDGVEGPSPHQKYAAGYALAITSFYCTPRWATRTPLYNLQQGVMLANWHLGASTPLVVWMCVSSSIRSGIDVGAHRNSTRMWTTDNLTDQLRKRAFWCLLVLDRTLACQLGRGVTLQDGDIDLDLPWEIDDDDLAPLERLSPFTTKWPAAHSTKPDGSSNFKPVPCLAGIRIQAAMSPIQFKALRTIYAPKKDHMRRMAEVTNTSPLSASRWEERIVAELEADLTKWYNSIPDYLRWNDKRALNTDMDKLLAIISSRLHVKYFGTQILVHREFVDPQKQGVLTWPSLSICQNSARSLCHVLAYLTQNDLLKYCWVDIPLQATNTSTLLLLSISEAKRASNQVNHSILSDIQKCIDAMLAIQQTSYIAHQTIVGLKELCAVQGMSHGLRFVMPGRNDKDTMQGQASAGGRTQTSTPHEHMNGQTGDMFGGNRAVASDVQARRGRPSSGAHGRSGPAGLRQDMPPPQESPFSTVSNIQPDITNPASSTNQDPNAVPEQNYSHEQVPFMEDQTFPYLSQPWQLEMMNPPYSNQSFPPVPHQDARNEMSESTQIQVAGGLPSSNYAGFDDTMQQTNSDQPASDGMHRSGMNTTPHWSEISDGWTNAIPADARNNLMTTSPMTLETGMQGPPSMNQPPVYSAIPNGAVGVPVHPPYSAESFATSRQQQEYQRGSPDLGQASSTTGFQWETFLPGMPGQGMQSADWLNSGRNMGLPVKMQQQAVPPSAGSPDKGMSRVNIVHPQPLQQYPAYQPQPTQQRGLTGQAQSLQYMQQVLPTPGPDGTDPAQFHVPYPASQSAGMLPSSLPFQTALPPNLNDSNPTVYNSMQY